MAQTLRDTNKITPLDRRSDEIGEVDGLKKQFRALRFNKIVNCCYQGVDHQLAQATEGSDKEKLIALKVALAAVIISNSEPQKN
jgi:hypothetical protein